MLKILTGFPDNVLAAEWRGDVSAEDYRTVLVPAAEAKIRQHKHLRLFAVIGPSFSGISAGAMWEDAKIGIGHWGDWGRIAVVTDIGWIRDSAKLFAPLFHHPMRTFAYADLAAAKAWISEAESKAA